MKELAEACLAFCFLPQGVYKNISVVGGGGALGVIACDAAENFGMDIPALAPGIRQRVEDLLPKPGTGSTNPIDVAGPFVEPKILRDILHTVTGDDRIDLQIMVLVLYHYKMMARMLGKPLAQATPYREMAEFFSDVVKETGKPIIVVLASHKRGVDDLDIVEMLTLARREFLSRGLPVFDDLYEAIRAVGHVNTYYEKGERYE